MNLNIQLTIPFKNSSEVIKIDTNTLLTPFYITERELLSVYLQEWSPRFEVSARELIFYASIRAEELLKLKLKYIPDEEMFSLKRQLTLCIATIAFGNKFNSDFIKSMSRSKTLADFTVSTTVSNDTSFLSNIIKDAQACVADIESIIQELNSGDSTTRIFVKGGLNYRNYDTSRLWLHRNIEEAVSRETHASRKEYVNGRLFKNGGNYRNAPASRINS